MSPSRWARVAAGIDRIFIVSIAGGFGAIGVLVFWLWNASPAVLKHATHVAGALAPAPTLFAVFVAAIGWYVARGIEREKRETANEAVRDRMRARFVRIWGVIRQAVRSEKPYNPGSIKHFLGSIKFFLNEIQKIYWEVDTFAAFTRPAHDLLRKALDDCQLDYQKATRTANDPENWKPGECFRQSLAALKPVFYDVFGDEDIGAEISALQLAEEPPGYDPDEKAKAADRIVSRRIAAGLAVVAGTLGVSSYFALASAVVPMRVAAGLLLLAVGLYNFWRAMTEKG